MKKVLYNKPYRWLPDYHSTVIVLYSSEKRWDEQKFLNAIPIEGVPDIPILTCESSEERLKKFDWVRATISTPVVNKRTLEILKKVCPKDFQAFPITIRNLSEKDPWENRDYFILNVIRTVDALDLEKSEIEYWDEYPDEIYKVKKKIFKENSMRDYHLALEKNDTVIRIISPFLRKVLKKEKVKGVFFLEDGENKK